MRVSDHALRSKIPAAQNQEGRYTGEELRTVLLSGTTRDERKSRGCKIVEETEGEGRGGEGGDKRESRRRGYCRCQ